MKAGAMSDLEPNQQTIGAYRLDVQLGVDGAGEVYRAYHVPSGQPVAIRLLPGDRMALPGFRERFEREMRRAAALYHPHLIELYESGVSEGRAFVVSELAPGGSLRELMQRGAVSLRLGAELVRQAAVALEAVHARAMVHGAIKPENLLLFPESGGGYLLKLGDLGLARLSAPDAIDTMPYRAPEQRAGSDPDVHADLYALGAVLYEIAVGTPPPATGIPPLGHVNPDVPRALEAIVARCLTAPSAGRFASAAELAAALEDLVAQMAPRLSAAAAADVTVIERLPTHDDATMAAAIVPPAPVDVTIIEATSPAPPAAAPADATLVEPAVVAPADATLVEPAVAATPASAVADATAALLADETPEVQEAGAPQVAPGVINPDEAVTILPEPLPAISTPIPEVAVTRSLMIATPPPGFPALPPPLSMPQVQVLDSQGMPLQLVNLTGDGLAVGRAATSDLVLADESVSEEHAFIDWDGRQVTVSDLGSKNGVILAGVRLAPQERRLWEGGVPLRIGVYWLRLVPAMAQATSMIAPAQYGIPGPTAAAVPRVVAPPPPAPRPAGSVTPGFGAPAMVGPTAAIPQAGGITQTPSAGMRRDAPAVPQAAVVAPPETADAIPDAGVTQPPLGSNRYGVELEQDVTTLTPGMPTVLRLTLHNYSENVDHLRVEVRGVPETWIQGPPPEPQLLPNGRQPVALNINVPRTPEHRAGPYPVTIYARSRSRPNEAGIAQATWTVQAFTEHRLELKPRRATGWRKASYNLTLTNAGNVPSRYTLSGEDDEQVLDFGLGPEVMPLDPGVAVKRRLTVRGPIRWFGTPQPRSFSIHARTEKRSEAQTSSAQFVQRALVPPWIIPLLLLSVAAILYFVTRPPVVRNPRFDPSPLVAGQPARLSYEIDNAQRVELQPIGVPAPAASGRRSYEFLDAAAIPPDLSIRAVSRFGIIAEAPVAAVVVTPTPTPLPPTPTPAPPTPAPAEPLPAPTPAPEPPVIVAPPLPPQPPPPVETPAPAVTLSELVRFTCESGARIVLTGSGPPRESFLLYFGRRAVSGGSVAPDGVYRIDMVIGRERPGEYPVSVRLRLSDRPLAIRTYRYGNDPLVRLSDAAPEAVPTELMCVVRRETPTPTIAP